MYKKIPVVFLFFLVWLSSVNAAGSGIVMGRLSDRNTHKSIELANVVLVNNMDSILLGTLTDAKGRFIFEKIPFGFYHIKVSSIGYDSFVSELFELKQKFDKKEFPEIMLAQISYQLSEATVEATKEPVSFHLDKKVVDVSKLIDAAGSSVSDALQNVPSVKVDGDGTVYLRGSTHFKLLIDGKPSILSPSDALQQIPAESIQKIEIITSPSSRYDSEGAAGIINLVSKKQKLEGFSGQSALTVGSREKYAANILINKKTGNNNFTGGITYNNRFKDAETETERFSYLQDSTLLESMKALREIRRKNIEISATWDHDINNNNSFSVAAKGGIWSFKRNIETEKYTSLFPDNYSAQSDLLEHFTVENKYITLDAFYVHKFSAPESKITISGNFGQLNNTTGSGANEIDKETNLSLQNNALNRNYKQQNYLSNIDYSRPLFDNYKLELGGQSKGIRLSPEQTFFTEIAGNPITENQLSGQVNFSDYSNSVYAQITGAWKSIDFSGGIRLENENRNLQDNQDISYNYNEFFWFPSFQVSKEISEQQQLNLAYSKRIEKPTENRLNPLPTMVSAYAVSRGNPYLNPEVTQAIEIGYHVNLKRVLLNLEAFTRKAENAMENSMIFIDGNYYDSYENITERWSYGTEFMANLKIASWFNLNLNANAFYESLNGTLQDGYVINNASFTWESNGKATFIIRKNTTFDCLAYYYGPRIFSRGKAEQFYYIDFVLRHYFMNRKLMVSLKTHNTFDTGLYSYYSEGSNYYYKQNYVFEGPIFFLGVSYKFNNYKAKRNAENMEMNFDGGLDNL